MTGRGIRPEPHASWNLNNIQQQAQQQAADRHEKLVNWTNRGDLRQTCGHVKAKK